MAVGAVRANGAAPYDFEIPDQLRFGVACSTVTAPLTYTNEYLPGEASAPDTAPEHDVTALPTGVVVV